MYTFIQSGGIFDFTMIYVYIWLLEFEYINVIYSVNSLKYKVPTHLFGKYILCV